MDSLEEGDIQLIDMGEFNPIADVLEQLAENGSEWRDLLDICLLASAWCAQNSEMTTDEYLQIVSSIRVSDDGIYGEA
jgi:hypothetical protein